MFFTVWRLAARNLRVSFKKQWILLTVIAFCAAILLAGNSILAGIDSGMRTSYRSSYTGDLSVSALSPNSFNIFGSDAPIVGDYEVVPPIPAYPGLARQVSGLPGVDRILPLLTGRALLEVRGNKTGVLFFGVDFTDYRRFFPDVSLVAGDWPAPGQAAVMLTELVVEKYVRTHGLKPAIGDRLAMSVFSSGGFSIREVVLSGIIRLPVSDEMANNLVVIDTETARSLNGLIVGSAAAGNGAPAPAGTGTGPQGLDDLFSDPAATQTIQVQSSGSLLDPTEAALRDTDLRQRSNATLPDSWNFLLVRTAGGAAPGQVQSALAARLDPAALQVRDWRGTGGGMAQIVFVLQIIFNAGMFFIIIATLLIIINSLVLATFKRTKEIGTMRALGARRSLVAWVVLAENVMSVGGAGLAGLLLGCLGLAVLNAMQLGLGNPLLVSLFGSTRLSAPISFFQLVWHALALTGVAVVATLYPLRIALAISPVSAMARD